jgi:hypothetical protein
MPKISGFFFPMFLDLLHLAVDFAYLNAPFLLLPDVLYGLQQPKLYHIQLRLIISHQVSFQQLHYARRLPCNVRRLYLNLIPLQFDSSTNSALKNTEK